jgi:hypothetical protein
MEDFYVRMRKTTLKGLWNRTIGNYFLAVHEEPLKGLKI